MENDFKGASVDRIDNTKGYTMDNLQLLPIKDNISKDHRKAVNGSCECYVCHEVKPLEEFTRSSRSYNGYKTICRSCERIRRRNKDSRRKAK